MHQSGGELVHMKIPRSTPADTLYFLTLPSLHVVNTLSTALVTLVILSDQCLVQSASRQFADE